MVPALPGILHFQCIRSTEPIMISQSVQARLWDFEAKLRLYSFCTVSVSVRLCHKGEWVIFPPVLAFSGKSTSSDNARGTHRLELAAFDTLQPTAGSVRRYKQDRCDGTFCLCSSLKGLNKYGSARAAIVQQANCDSPTRKLRRAVLSFESPCMLSMLPSQKSAPPHSPLRIQGCSPCKDQPPLPPLSTSHAAGGDLVCHSELTLKSAMKTYGSAMLGFNYSRRSAENDQFTLYVPWLSTDYLELF